MKKLFGIIIAVVAMTMVSCSGVSVEDEVDAAAKAKDVTRLVAIGDSIEALGNQVDGKMQAVGAVSYAMAYQLINQVRTQHLASNKVKGYKAYDDCDTFGAFYDDFRSLYDSSKAKDAEAAQAVYDGLKKQCGATIEDLLFMAKQDRDISVQTKLQQAAID